MWPQTLPKFACAQPTGQVPLLWRAAVEGRDRAKSVLPYSLCVSLSLNLRVPCVVLDYVVG